MTDNQSSPQKQKTFAATLTRVLTPVVVILAVVLAGFQYLHFHATESQASPINSQAESPISQKDATSGSESPQELKAGVVIPDIKLRTLSGQETQFSKLGAKVVILTFWATWCGPCITEMPSIERLYQHYKAQGLDVIAVDLDDKPEAVVPKMVKKLGVTFPIYVDLEQNLSTLFDIQGIPLTMVIDKNRKVLELEGGERDWNDARMQQKMKTWLGT